MLCGSDNVPPSRTCNFFSRNQIILEEIFNGANSTPSDLALTAICCSVETGHPHITCYRFQSFIHSRARLGVRYRHVQMAVEETTGMKCNGNVVMSRKCLSEMAW